MLKNIISIFIALYIVASTMYLGYLLIPNLSKYVNKYTQKIKTNKIIVSIKEENETKNNIIDPVCANFSLGYIASNNSFTIENRLKNTFKQTLKLKNGKLNYNIEEISCDTVGNLMNIFYDSKLYHKAMITNYEYTAPISNKKNNDLELKTVLKPFSTNKIDLQSGYIVAIEDISNSNLSPVFYKISQEEEEVILGTCDTIFFELTSNNPGEAELEYMAVKTDFNNNGVFDYFVLSNWYHKSLPKGLKYTTLFALIFDNNNSAKRYTLLPFTSTRNSNFFIEQILDLDNNNYKEVIVRRVRNFQDNFIIFKYSKEKNSFNEI
jgi:hypothetical protein